MFSKCIINYKINRKFFIIIFFYLILMQQVNSKKFTFNKMESSGKRGATTFNNEHQQMTHEIGTILFEDHGFTKKCFTQNDIALLATRLKFQTLLPNKETVLEDDDSIETKIRYFYSINEVISRMSHNEIRELINKAFYDMLGGYLKHFLLPVAKYSYYAGNVTFNVVNNLFNLYEKCKELLNTNGNSWKEPITDFSSFSFKIDKITIVRSDSDNDNNDDEMKACVNLILNRGDADNDEDMLVALPKIEFEESDQLSTIWIPFKRKHIFNLNSRTSAFILLRYFVQTSKCYNYQATQQSTFNARFKAWIVDNVLPYLDDDKLYPAFGAVLRILETIKQPDDSNYLGIRSSIQESSKQLFPSNFGDLKQEDLMRITQDPDSSYEEMKKYINFAIIIVGGFVFLLVLIYCLVRMKKNRELMEKRNLFKQQMSRSSKSDDSRHSMKEKMRKVFTRSSQSQSAEEGGLSKRSDSDDLFRPKSLKSVRWENEKKKKTSSEKLKKSSSTAVRNILPNLYSESESDGEDIILKKIPLSSSKTKVPSKHERFLDNPKDLYRISEDSETSSKSSKSKSKSTPKSSSSSTHLPDQTKSPGIFGKLRKRSKSPEKR